jgi:hypothetical protein
MNIKKILIGALVLGMVAFSSASAATYTWTSSLSVGSTGEQVKNLQKFLNMYPAYQVATSGVGSPGYESSYFGLKTKAAVIKFQAANGISPIGIFGPMSRAKAMAMQDGGTTTTPGNLPAGCTSTSGFSPVTGVSCASGNTTSQSGSVTASLAASNPASGYIIDNQASAGLLDVTFTGTGIVNSVTLQRSGISDQNTLDAVYLYDGVTRLTDGYSFNSASQIVMNNLNLAVNGSRTISVKADANTSASDDSTIAVALVSFTAGTTTNAVNIKGNDMFLASGSSVASATLSANSVSNANVNAGITGYTFWSAPIQINTHAVSLKSAAFRMIGSAPSDAIGNIKLYVDGVDVGVTATVTSLQGSNYAMFNLSSMPKTLSTGSHTLDVRGNVEKGSSRTVQFSLQQAADLMLYDAQVGVNIAIGSFTANNGGTITINSGSLTINNDPAFQALTTVTGGASNVTIAKFKLHAYGEDVKVSSLPVEITLGNTTSMAPATTTLEDVSLYFNGSQVGSQQDMTDGTPATFQLGSQMIVPAGVDSWLEVRANIRNAAGANYTAGDVAVDLNVGSSNAQGQTSFTSVSTPAVSGNELDIQTALLVVAKNPNYANQTVTPNTAGVKIGSFNLQNQSSSESVRVTNLAVDLEINSGAADMTSVSTPALTNLSGLKVSDSSTVAGQPQTSNSFSTDFTLAPGATKTVEIWADTGSYTGGVNFSTELTVTSIGVTSNVSATSSAVNGQFMTTSVGTIGTPEFTSSSSTSEQYIATGANGVTDAAKQTFKFISTGGSSTISELKFNRVASNALVNDGITFVKVGNVTAPMVNGVAYLTGLSIAVPQGGAGKTVDAYVSYSGVGTNGIPSADYNGADYTVRLDLDYVKYTSGGTTTTDTGLAIAGNAMHLVASKPTVALTLPNNVAGSSTTGLTVGMKHLADVRVTADSKGDISLQELYVNLDGNAAGTTIDGASVVIKDGSGNVVTDAYVFANGGNDADTYADIYFDNNSAGYTIAAGTTAVFRIEANVTAVAGASSSVAVSLDQDAFSWDDVSGTDDAGDWSEAGSVISGFPTSSVSMTN